jgi:hypothetical protein
MIDCVGLKTQELTEIGKVERHRARPVSQATKLYVVKCDLHSLELGIQELTCIMLTADVWWKSLRLRLRGGIS